MNELVRYGQLESEKLAEQNQQCRQIAREISVFGITERQRLLLVYLLAMEFENPDWMRTITSQIKELAGDQLFLSGRADNTGGLSGTNDI